MRLIRSLNSFILLVGGCLLCELLPQTLGHGYLKSPRSRNYVAYHSKWWPLDDELPFPDSNVQSLNQPGAVCGKFNDKNYDYPKNNKGAPLMNQIQAVFDQADLIDLDVVLTAYHQGHFVYKACPISVGGVATQECFDANPLTFVEDNLYGAVPDPNYPERAYLPKSGYQGIMRDTEDVPGNLYSHKYRLPSDLTGSNVLVQWQYVTANSGCSHQGYNDYPWPQGFGGYQSNPCPLLTFASINEQFLNCCEVEILSSSTTSTSSTTTTTIGATTTSMTVISGVLKKFQGESCELNSHCWSDSCFGGVCECRDDLDCPEDEICSVVVNDENEFTFMCLETSLPTGAGCVHPNQCASGSCFQKTCECRDDSHCPLREVCEEIEDGSFDCVLEPSKPPSSNPVIQTPTSSPVSTPSSSPSTSAVPSIKFSPRPVASDVPSQSPSNSSQPSSTSTSTSPSLSPSISSAPSEPSKISSHTSQPSNDPTSRGSYDAVVGAYYASWQWYDRSKKAAPQNLDFTKVDRVYFAFFQTNEDGFIWGTDSWADPIVLFGGHDWNPPPNTKKRCSWDGPNRKSCNVHKQDESLIHLVHQAGGQIFPSLGGWTLSDAFPAMAANPVARKRFAEQCVELIEDYEFDGIDLGEWARLQVFLLLIFRL